MSSEAGPTMISIVRRKTSSGLARLTVPDERVAEYLRCVTGYLEKNLLVRRP
jgi:hypothetical protein